MKNEHEIPKIENKKEREVTGVKEFLYKTLKLPKNIYIPNEIPTDPNDPEIKAVNCSSFVKMVLRMNGIILTTEKDTTVDEIIEALDEGQFKLEKSTFKDGEECREIFGMRSTTPYAPQMEYDHMGFRLLDEKLMDMSGHRYTDDDEPLPPKIYEWEELENDVDEFGQKVFDTSLTDPEIAKNVKHREYIDSAS